MHIFILYCYRIWPCAFLWL